jgi:AAA15 family ATPase/GTPase
MLSVTEVSIERFKRASKVTFPVGDVNVIVGGNNSGKSSSIQGLHFFFTLLQSIELAGKWNRKHRTTIAPEELIYSPARDPIVCMKKGTFNSQRS